MKSESIHLIQEPHKYKPYEITKRQVPDAYIGDIYIVSSKVKNGGIGYMRNNHTWQMLKLVYL